MRIGNSKRFLAVMLLVACAWLPQEVRAADPPASKPDAPAAKAIDPPETVVVTYRPKAGQDEAVEALIQQHWKTIQKLGMVLPEPHLLYRGKDGKGTFFVNIITWKTHDTPDTAPAEVTAIWNSMMKIVEKRDCRRGIEFDEVFELPLAVP